MASSSPASWLQMMFPYDPSTIPGTWYDQMQSKWGKRTEYLGKDYDPAALQKTINQVTLWASSQGAQFEIIQKAAIKGCAPGNFKTIDSIEKLNVNGLSVDAGVSLKSMFLENRDPVFPDNARQLFTGYLKELVEFAGDSRNLQKLDNTGSAKTEVWISELGALVLRIGIPQSVFNSQTLLFTDIAATYSAKEFGGRNPGAYNMMDYRKNNRLVPVKVEFVAAPDTIFNPGYGEHYEQLKHAEIDNEPPGTFKTIDKWVPAKDRIVSYKAHDLVNNYQGKGADEQFARLLKEEIDVLAAFSKYTEKTGWQRSITSDDFKQKRLSIAIPKNTDMGRFHPIFDRAFYYAAAKGVLLRVHLTS